MKKIGSLLLSNLIHVMHLVIHGAVIWESAVAMVQHVVNIHVSIGSLLLTSPSQVHLPTKRKRMISLK